MHRDAGTESEDGHEMQRVSLENCFHVWKHRHAQATCTCGHGWHEGDSRVSSLAAYLLTSREQTSQAPIQRSRSKERKKVGSKDPARRKKKRTTVTTNKKEEYTARPRNSDRQVAEDEDFHIHTCTLAFMGKGPKSARKHCCIALFFYTKHTL